MTDNNADAALWCVHVSGPDDMVATISYEHAVAMAVLLNTRWYRHLLVDFSENDPYMWATPARWPYSQEIHAAALMAPSDGYRDVFAATDPERKLRATVAYDGFAGDIIGWYLTREGHNGLVIQQDGTRVVHVYHRAKVVLELRQQA